MELRHLRYFVTVAELGSISRAAEKLFMAQPPLSAQIRQLEDEVGASLLLRVPRGVRLTPAGRSFLDDARAILARSQQAAVRARELEAGQRRTWRIGLMPSSTHTLLPGLLRRVQDTALPVRIETRELAPSSRQLRALRNDELDLGFLRPGDDFSGGDIVAGIDDPYCLALPPGHPLAAGAGPLPLRQAAHEVFVSFSRHTESDYFDQTAALCVEAGFTPDIRHEAGQFVGVLTLVACGLGVAIVPASCATMPFGVGAGVVLRRLSGSRHKSRLVIVASERRLAEDDSDVARQFVQLAVDELQAMAQKLAHM